MILKNECLVGQKQSNESVHIYRIAFVLGMGVSSNQFETTYYDYHTVRYYSDSLATMKLIFNMMF